MVRARLHVICGNCGCNDEFEWEYVPVTEDAPEGVNITCKNCGTIHQLNDNANNKLNVRGK